MPPEFDEEEKPSLPGTPLAIDRLTLSVNAMREELRTSLAKLEANFALIMTELDGLMRSRADHEVRITELERERNTRAKGAAKRSPKSRG
jgi:hypothetical protein